MDPGVIHISKFAVPRTNFQVRRRRYNDTIWLVHHNEWYVLDELSDYVWRSCEAATPVGEIIQQMAIEKNISSSDALAAAIYALDHFRELGFVTWDKGEFDLG